MNTGRQSLFALFATLDEVQECLRVLRKSKFDSCEVYAPVPHHELHEAIHEPGSPVKYFTLGGAIGGFCIGWGITLGPLANFSLHVGGKPLASIPPFAVVAYICTILFGALATVAGFIICSRLPERRLVIGYDPKLSSDTYALNVAYGVGERSRLRTILETEGAMSIVDSQGTDDAP